MIKNRKDKPIRATEDWMSLFNFEE